MAAGPATWCWVGQKGEEVDGMEHECVAMLAGYGSEMDWLNGIQADSGSVSVAGEACRAMEGLY